MKPQTQNTCPTFSLMLSFFFHGWISSLHSFSLFRTSRISLLNYYLFSLFILMKPLFLQFIQVVTRSILYFLFPVMDGFLGSFLTVFWFFIFHRIFFFFIIILLYAFGDLLINYFFFLLTFRIL